MSPASVSENPLAVWPIPKLILKYSVPTAMTLMVNYLYNIVDQVFIGQGVGVAGMAATNVSFPLTIVAIAIALLIGDGCAANISLCLGRKDQRAADQTVSHAVSLLLASSLVLALVCTLFAPQLVRLLGATETAYADSLSYARVIIWGLPFLMYSSALSAVFRADGTPQLSMRYMMIGAVINLVLDPVFIFILDMGVIGAGIATVLGEAVSGGLFLLHLRALRTVRITRSYLRPTPALSAKILCLGIPSFVTQILTASVQIVMNNMMTIYGAATIYGSDIALSVYGMMMKVYQIAHSMFVGVSSATQPINGYNFGAKQYARVRETYRTAAGIALLLSAAWFLVYQFLSRPIGLLFVSGDELYLACTRHIFHIYMLAFFLYGLHLTTTSFFQGIGKPGRALLIPVARQGCVLIPLCLLLSARYGLDGALFAVPIADVFAFLLSLLLAGTEFSRWKKQSRL